MAKNRNKTKRDRPVSMDTSEHTIFDVPQDMDTSESGTKQQSASTGKLKGRQMKKSKNVRKMKAKAKAISQNEKITQKVSKNDRKSARILSAKSLYE